MAVTIATMRLYNVPTGISDAKVTEHLAKATAERTQRMGSATYTGTLTDQYDEILIHLTWKRLYRFENIFFVQGIPTTATDVKENMRLFSPEEVRIKIDEEEKEAAALIKLLLNTIADADEEEDDDDDAVMDGGGITMLAVGGNEDYKQEQRSR